MKIVTLNVKGAQKAKNTARVAEYLMQDSFDLIVLSEYGCARHSEVRHSLKARGFTVEVSKPSIVEGDAVLVACKSPFQTKRRDKGRLAAFLPDLGATVLGVYLPAVNDRMAGRNEERKRFWSSVHEFAEEHSTQRALIAGDFNSNLAQDNAHHNAYCDNEIEHLTGKLGWMDAWRDRGRPDGMNDKYTWYWNSKIGARLDYVFLSPQLHMAHSNIRAKHEHSTRQRDFTDHSALVVEF